MVSHLWTIKPILLCEISEQSERERESKVFGGETVHSQHVDEPATNKIFPKFGSALCA